MQYYISDTLWHKTSTACWGQFHNPTNIIDVMRITTIFIWSPCYTAYSREPSPFGNGSVKIPTLICLGVKFPLSLCQICGFTEVDPYLMHDKGKCWGRDKRGIQPEGSPPQRTILAADWLSACWEGLSCKNTSESTEEPQIFMSIPN